MGRHRNPLWDAEMLVAIRRAVGPGVALRADANRKWSLNQAVAFGHAVAEANLQVLCLRSKWRVAVVCGQVFAE